MRRADCAVAMIPRVFTVGGINLLERYEKRSNEQMMLPVRERDAPLE